MSTAVQQRGITRRAFLATTTQVSLAGLAMTAPRRTTVVRPATRCVQINLIGGPCGLDSFDPKPDAPASVRGPFAAISTKIHGIYLSEGFPRLAARLDRIALLRTVYHDAAALHVAGLQLLQTGRLVCGTQVTPHLGAVLAANAHANEAPAWVILGAPLVGLDARARDGQTAGDSQFVKPAWIPEQVTKPWPAQVRELLSQGTRFVTLNTASHLHGATSWDCHADPHGVDIRLARYPKLAAALDRNLCQLLDDLEECGLLDETLVVVHGEMGRTPYLNVHGGRDHWTRAWPVLLAGGPIRPGQVIGQTDALGGEPVDCPIHAAQIAATVAAGLDVELPGIDATPVHELFG